MKNYIVLCFRCLYLTALLAAGCGTDEAEDAAITTDRSTVNANKRGMTSEGGDVTFEVRSNVYWVIRIDEDADWLTVSPRAAYGDRTVTITAQANAGAARSTMLRFDSLDGVTAEIEVRQGSWDELINFLRTGAGSVPVAERTALADFTAWEADGVGAVNVLFTGTDAFVTSAVTSAGYDGATGGNSVHLCTPAAEAQQEADPSVAAFVVRGVQTKENTCFRLRAAVRAEQGTVSPEAFRLRIGNGGDQFTDLGYEVLDTGSEQWKEVLARFRVGDETTELDLRMEALSGAYYIDDLRLSEGNAGEGEEVVFQKGADDGREAGYVYFEEDFGWVTEVYRGTDYIGPYPDSPTAEQYWNGVTAAAFGEEAYATLVNSGWKTDDNRLKERVYLRIGYVKMGRGSNAAGCGGGLVSPAMNIRKNRSAKLKVSFDCCTFVSTGGVWDPAKMQVRILGAGTIDGGASTVKPFLMQTETPLKWETKEFLVYGADNTTQIVFESIDEITANRWFFDNVRIVKAGAGDEPVVERTSLAAPVVACDEAAATVSSVKFSWGAVAGAASYEYVCTCLNCGEEVSSRSGTTPETCVEFIGLIPGTGCRLTVRALPSEDDPLHEASAWSEPAEGTVRDAAVVGADTHPAGYAFVDDDLSWITQAFCGNEDFVANFPSSAAGLRMDKLSDEGKVELEARGWAMTAANSSAYLYAGSIKLGTASATGSVFTPAVSGIDEGTKVNAVVTLGGTAFLGTNSYYDDDAAAISIVGAGTFDDGTTMREFRMRTWNEWLRQRFEVLGIDNQTRFRIESRTAAKGRIFINYFGVEKLPDDYDPAGELPRLATPEGVTIDGNAAYGFDAAWNGVPDATDYTYFVTLPDGTIAATGKTWEPRVHIGGLAGKTLSEKYAYFNFRVVANHMNYNASKVEIPQTFRSSQSSVAVKAEIAPSAATVYCEDDFAWISPASGSTLLATNTDWINTYCTVDKMVRLDLLEQEGTVPLHGWGYDAKNKSVYTRPGYLHLNSSSALGNLISPPFGGIAGTDDVLVSFDATGFYQYFSGAADPARLFTVRVLGAGRIEGATDGVATFTLGRGNAWEGFSFRITGADAATRVVFAPASSSKNRVQFDNFRVESLTR